MLFRTRDYTRARCGGTDWRDGGFYLSCSTRPGCDRYGGQSKHHWNCASANRDAQLLRCCGEIHGAILALAEGGFLLEYGLMQTTKTPRRRAATRVRTGHHLKPRLTGNRAKLASLIRVFDLRVGVVAKCTGRFSRTYVQRVISPRDDFEGSAEFYRLIESALPELVRRRRRSFFNVPSVDSRRVDQLVRATQPDFSRDA